MHSFLARIPFVRRPFYQRDVALRARDLAVLERDAAIKERDALKRKVEHGEPRETTAEPPLAPERRSAGPAAGLARLCVFCNGHVDAWEPYRIRASEMSDFLSRLDCVGSNVERFACPHCESFDRERHLRLFLDRLGLMDAVRGGAVLHMAPERRLRDYIESHGPGTYVRGDLSTEHEGVQEIDLQHIPYPDETFDMVICNHILEHVDDATAALREMHRVLKPSGRAICQTPFAARLTTTFADPLLQSPDDRLFFYGQEDHVRLFGADIAQWFRQAGFVGRLVPHAEILPDVDPEGFGVNEKEPFFDFVRG
jgi:SAM-dependent methyltransferase